MKLRLRASLTGMLVAAGIFCVAGPATLTAFAQGTVSQPVVVKTPKPNNKPLKFVGTVVAANAASMTVRSDASAVLVQSFSYAPAIRNQMVKIVQKGGYQFGDKVTIEYAPNTTVALKIKGKPSKPKAFGNTATAK